MAAKQVGHRRVGRIDQFLSVSGTLKSAAIVCGALFKMFGYAINCCAADLCSSGRIEIDAMYAAVFGRQGRELSANIFNRKLHAGAFNGRQTARRRTS